MNNEPPYSNRELDVKFKILGDNLEENHQETMNRIELMDRKNHDKFIDILAQVGEIRVQTTTTNGKVRKLEKWQAGLIMAGSVALFMGSVIIAMGIYIYNLQVARITNLRNTVQQLQTK